MSSPKISVTVDTREPVEMFTGLSAILPGVKREKLDSADFSWVKLDGKTRGVERKDWGDLLSSLQSGRLEQELAGCVEKYDFVDLLVEGAIYPNQVGQLVKLKSIKENLLVLTNAFVKMNSPQYACFLSSLGEHGINFLWSPSASGTPVVIRALYLRDQKEAHKFLVGERRPKADTRHLPPPVLAILGACPRLSTEVAQELVTRFGGLLAVGNLIAEGSTKTLLEIPGLGRETIRKLAESLGLKGEK